ncbi:hypothetical protein [Halpernia frigidisoli]|uniref:Uncharacterized protein n=1 Tax=Halpernia frigidisoli TaxID=1125876 RepID=A0A1I3CQY5_9FLAO|nr:hypothetical protein [Halpernia frigidisoli]SFH76932.1 hypothetical protein SAMN05443292_0023 [Halpernia frigidisoli]
MEFKTWLEQTKIENTNLETFIIKLEPYFSDSGFNGLEFERKVAIGLQKIDTEINELLKPENDAENQ